MSVSFYHPVPIDAEPKRKGRYVLQFPTELGIAEWSILAAARPNLTINETEIPVLNTTHFVAGKYLWEPMEVTFLDAIGPMAATRGLIDWIKKCVKALDQNPMGTYAMGYAADYMIPIRIYMLDPGGIPVETWVLENCFCTKLDGGDLSKEDDGLANYSITIRYLNARLEVF